jgi:phosphopantetheinyl transferase (holo-ACP synthase)
MILGAGIDLVDLEEFSRTLERGGNKYIEHVYTVEEISCCRAQPRPLRHFGRALGRKRRGE